MIFNIFPQNIKYIVYYIMNQDLELQDDQMKCICGVVHKKFSIYGHLKSKKHLNFVNNVPEIIGARKNEKRQITCECGSKYKFKSQLWKEAHERSYSHCKYIKTLLNE